MSSITCSDYEVANILSSISNTSPGLDGMPAWVFRTCSIELSDVVASIFNQSICTGKIPDSWLTAIVTPVPKVKKPLVVTDYRPISVTPILSRILEGIVVRKYLQPALTATVIRDQYAYKITGSTTCALINLMHSVTKHLETCSYVRCVMIDFSKAFDTVDRIVLLNKLDALDVPKCIKVWIASFLSERYQMVACDGDLSSVLPVNRGIVQGSALGPTLFTIMVSDLRPISSDNDLIKFADDLTLIAPEFTDTDISDEMNAISAWAVTNKLAINYTKTKEVVFHRPKPSRVILPPPLTGIERVFMAKLLGVTLTSSFSYAEHVDSIVKQCNQRSFLLRTLRRRGLNAKVLEAIFNALIVSRILYAISAWGGFVTAADKGRLNALLLKCKKFGYCDTITTFEQLLMTADRKLFRKTQSASHCLHHMLPAIRNTSYALRERGHPFTLPHCTHSLFKRSFFTRMLFDQV
jgi:hypothetical protein